MASTYLTRTQGTGTSRQKWTLSMWIKKTGLNGNMGLMSTNNGWQDGSGMAILFQPTEVLNIYNPIQGETGGAGYNQSTRVFRDTNAFYHFVFSADSTLTTQADRLKIYVNGEQLSYATSNLPGQNIFWNDLNFSGQSLNIGSAATANNYFDGSMSHVHFCDGTALAPTVFGEYDANGVWKIIVDPTFTLGTNGFTILKDGNTITDQSSNSNNFTVGGGTLTTTEDSPSNVFATLNPLHRGNELGRATFSNGNTKHEGTSGGGYYPYSNSTLASSSGKYYAEFKQIQGDSMMGISDGKANAWPGSGTNDYVIYKGGEVFNNGTSESWGNAISNNVIVGVAMDLDNNAVYWSLNGVWQNSGNPTSGSSRTGGKQITAPSSTFSGVYHFMCGKGGSAWTSIQANFGNGYFGTTAVASAGTNASGNGIFEYDVPTGYTALSTKGLNL